MKVSEIIYMVLDLAKAATSDDSYYTEEHVLSLCKTYRALLIKKEHDREKASSSVASEFEYQEICLDLEPKAAIDGRPCTGGYYLWTKQELPKMLEGIKPIVYPIDYYQGTNISYVSRDKMRFTGNNKYLNNIIYSSLGPDYHLYLNSNNPQFRYLKKIRVSAVFEDIEAASELLCDDAGNKKTCDVLDMEFPIREYLVPQLIEAVVRELTGAVYKPKDTANNGSDDLADIAAYLRRNVKSPLQKQIEG